MRAHFAATLLCLLLVPACASRASEASEKVIAWKGTSFSSYRSSLFATGLQPRREGSALQQTFSAPSTAQTSRESSMSDAEVEKLRDAAYVPTDRIEAFVKILDVRAKRIQDLMAKPRHPGREQQLHDLFDQFNAIAEELADNLDEYAPKHRDLRKILPKLLDATERWSTTLRSVPEDANYKVVHKLALDAVHDINEAATTMKTELAAYFKEHPEAEKAERDRMENRQDKPEVIDIPR
jgi:hypothetical protein